MTERIKIRLNNEELWKAMSALEFFMRMQLGQYEEINWYLRLHARNSGNGRAERNEAERTVLLLKMRDVIHPDLSGMPIGCSHGIYSGKTNPAAVDAHDLLQTLRYAESWYRMPQGGITLNFDEPSIRGRFPKADVQMSGQRSRGSAEITIVPEQLELMKEAAELYYFLTAQNFSDMFRTLSAGNEDTKTIAAQIEAVSSAPASKEMAHKAEELITVLRNVQEETIL